MGNVLYVDNNLKEFTNRKEASLPIQLLTEVKLPISVKSNLQYHAMDSLGNYLYVDKNNNITTEKESYVISDEDLFDTSTINTIVGTNIEHQNIFRTIKEKNKPYLKNPYTTKETVIDEDNCLTLDVDEVLYKDASNLLEESNFDKAIIDIMDSIVGGNYRDYTSFKVTLDSTQHVIFNITINIREGVMLYNIPEAVDIFINSIKVNRNMVDEYGGIYFDLESTELNIKIVNNTMNTVSVINPIILLS